jgi:hypothetical protein
MHRILVWLQNWHVHFHMCLSYVCWPTHKYTYAQVCLLLTECEGVFPRHAGRLHTRTEQYSLCLEASIHSIVYNSMCVHIKSDCGHFEMDCTLSHTSWMPTPTPNITLYVQRQACTPVCTTVQADVWYYGVCMCTKSDFGCLKWTYALSHVSWMPTSALVFYYVCWPAQRHAHVHLLLCKEAGIHPSMYTSTSRCIMCACASYLIMVTLKLTCALSKAS